MATNIDTSRESRRRKILERGADRFALISGRSHSIPSISEDIPLFDSLRPDPHCQDLSRQISGPFCDKLSPNSSGGEISVEPPLSTPETSIRTSRTSASDVDSNERPSLASPTEQRSSAAVAGGVQALEQLFSNRFAKPSQIISDIAATENSRLFCSVTVAIFVVLSSLGFPVLGSNTVRSILCFRPLYLVLLTNLTLVLAKLLLDNQRGFNRIVGEGNSSSTNYDWAEQAGNALEVGLLMKAAIDALVYAIIVVAGFCIFH